MDKDMAEGETGAHQGGRTRGGHPTGQKEEIEDSKRKMMYPGNTELGQGGIDYKRVEGNFGRCRMCVLSFFFWLCHPALGILVP